MSETGQTLTAFVDALRDAHEVQWEASPASRGGAGDDQVVRVVFDERRLAVRQAINAANSHMWLATRLLQRAVTGWEGDRTNGGCETGRTVVTTPEHEAHSDNCEGANDDN